MGFTIKTIFPHLNLSDEETRLHRLCVGRNVKSSYQSIYKSLPDKVDEDGYSVYQYPEEFKVQAERVIKRYLKKNNLVPIRRVRKRIPVTAYRAVVD
jgi:hypothetical protein